ncbi:MAG TPA: GGDEF domain-containing response regulator [Halothiobacillaceae bacterium]|nr:GGDEF domain-containing response regulator [Halothiobacillaceae bacterium]
MNATDYHNAHILIVDDHIANVTLLEDVLYEAEFTNVNGFTDPKAGFEYLQSHDVDLVLLDIRMPGMSGLEFLAAMQQKKKSVSVPVVVLTAQTDAPTREKALEAGALDFITKPFDSEEVIKRVNNILNIRYNAKQHAERADTLQDRVDEQTRELRALSLQELITGLPNRRAVKEHIHQLLHRGDEFVIFFIVINDMDEIAALHGYQLAEALLKELGDVLAASAIGQRGYLGCWGNSEYVLVYPLALDEAKMARLAQRLLRLLNGDILVENFSLRVHARIGMAHSRDLSLANNSEKPMDPGAIVGLATLALPINQSQGGFARYDDNLHQQLLRKNRIRIALGEAIKHNQLVLAYQPKVALNSCKLCGAETLLRWNHPEMGPISPGEFIPLAEHTGDVIALGRWVLKTAIAQIACWEKERRLDDNQNIEGRFSLAVNVASRQLMQPDFASELLGLVAHYQIEPKRLCVEVTESGLMEDIDMAIAQLSQLANAGIEIAIDDFGTGYSSLAYLRNLPMQVLKIDRQFVMELPHNHQDARIAETIVNMAHSLDCHVVAEGVEEISQYESLHEMGCEQAQGFLFSRPIPIETMNELLENGLDIQPNQGT